MKSRTSSTPVRLLPLLLAFACWSLSGCSIMGVTVQASAVLDGHILLGRANFPSEREGTIELQAQDRPHLSCFGPLRYTSSTAGVVSLSCNDGRSVRLAFQALSTLSGSGRAALGSGELALTYGLSPDQAASYLAVPASHLLPATGSAAPVRAEP